MPISNLYMLGPIVTTAGQLNQIQDYHPDLGIETVLHCGDGQVDYTYVAVMHQAPKLGFSTTAIARAMGYVGIGGLALTGPAEMWFQKMASGGTRTGGASSLKLASSVGMIVLKSIECEDKGPAKCHYEIVLLSADGVTAPFVVTPSSSMPSVTATDQLFVNGPVYVNGTALEGIKSMKIDFGIELAVEHGSGECYPTFCGIKRRKPMITFKTTDVSYGYATAGIVAQSATDSAVYLRKVAQNGTRVPNATAEHIKFSIDDGMITTKTVGGGGEGDIQMSEVTFEPTFDGVNDVVAVSLASAIS